MKNISLVTRNQLLRRLRQGLLPLRQLQLLKSLMELHPTMSTIPEKAQTLTAVNFAVPFTRDLSVDAEVAETALATTAADAAWVMRPIGLSANYEALLQGWTLHRLTSSRCLCCPASYGRPSGINVKLIEMQYGRFYPTGMVSQLLLLLKACTIGSSTS